MVATSSLGCQHLSQRNASANAETKVWEIARPSQVLGQERDHIKLRGKSRGRREEGGGGGRNVFGMKDSRLERRLAV